MTVDCGPKGPDLEAILAIVWGLVFVPVKRAEGLFSLSPDWYLLTSRILSKKHRIGLAWGLRRPHMGLIKRFVKNVDNDSTGFAYAYSGLTRSSYLVAVCGLCSVMSRIHRRTSARAFQGQRWSDVVFLTVFVEDLCLLCEARLVFREGFHSGSGVVNGVSDRGVQEK